MLVANKGIKHYDEIFKKLDDATLGDLLEASIFYKQVGGKFKERASKIDERVQKFTKKDMIDLFSDDKVEVSFDATTTYLFKETTKDVIEYNEEELLKLKGSLPSSYFKTVTKVVIDKSIIEAEIISGSLHSLAAPYVKKYSQTAMGFRKVPVVSSKKKVK
jgi:hypothetical protein